MTRQLHGAAPLRRDHEDMPAPHREHPGWRPTPQSREQARLEVDSWLSHVTAALAAFQGATR